MGNGIKAAGALWQTLSCLLCGNDLIVYFVLWLGCLLFDSLAGLCSQSAFLSPTHKQVGRGARVAQKYQQTKTCLLVLGDGNGTDTDTGEAPDETS
jgi:hypothetical protein